MNRREVLTKGLMGAVGLAVSSDLLTRQAEASADPEIKEQLYSLHARVSVALRDGADANLFIAREVYGAQVTHEEYKQVLDAGVELVKLGENVWGEDFWKKAMDEATKKKNLGASASASVLKVKQAIA